jgi:hypothetical protein
MNQLKNHNKYIIDNINFTMSMENMPLTNENKLQLQNCLEGKIDFDEAVAEMVKKFKKELV